MQVARTCERVAKADGNASMAFPDMAVRLERIHDEQLRTEYQKWLNEREQGWTRR